VLKSGQKIQTQRGLFLWLRNAKRDEKGIAALEFAWIAPVLIALYMGSVELYSAVTASRRVTDLASATADLTAQSADITGQVDDIFDAASTYMAQFGTDGLKITVTSICHDKNDKGRVDWSANYSGGGVNNYSHGDYVPLPTDANGDPALTSQGTGVILAEVEYKYTSPFGELVNSLTLADSYYLRPRLTNTLQRTDESSGEYVINTDAGGDADGCNSFM
jgi:Flp pilus assembly protein TadG